MIDLSFLTEEEQGVIMAVLKRDAELKRAEEHRVQELQRTVNDKVRLRFMTGEWFYETKQLRHQDRIHGSDIIMASMRHTHKPLTILELSQAMLLEPSSFVSSENKEVFVPPVLCGLLHQPPPQLSHQQCHNQRALEPPETSKPDVQSPTKRKNPFNSEFSAFDEQYREACENPEQNGEPLPLSDSSVYHDNIRREPDPVVQDPSATVVTPETSGSPDGLDGIEGPEGRPTDPASLRSILKHLDAPPSPDSPSPPPDPQDPVSVDSPAETWMDRKQVRFSSVVGRGGAEWQNGKELGEHSLLDVDSNCPPEAERVGADDCEKTAGDARRPTLERTGVDAQGSEADRRSETNLQEQDGGQQQGLGDEHCPAQLLSPTVSGPVWAEQEPGDPADPEAGPEEEAHSQDSLWPNRPNGHRPDLHEQSAVASVQATADPVPPPTLHSRALSPKPRQKTVDVFRRQKEGTDKVQSPGKEEEKIEETKLSLCATDTAEDNPEKVGREAKPSERPEVRTIQLAALQNTSFQDAGNSDGAVPFSQKLSSLKAFWERGNAGPKILFSRDKVQKGISETGLGSSLGPQPREQSVNSLPAAERTAGRTQDKIPSAQTHRSRIVYLSNEDGTYRAHPVLICEEADDSLTGSVTETQENTSPPLTSSVNAQRQQEDGPLCFPSLQEERPYDTTEPFLPSEFTKASVNTYSAKDATRSSVVVSFESDPRTPSNKDESEAKQRSPSKNRPSAVAKSSKVTEKGFVSQSPDRFLLKSTDDQQVNVEAGYPEGPRSPCKSPKPRSKDQDEDVRVSPSKTCHPRVLPRESSSPTRSKLEGSPLKTFPIDINPQCVEEQQEKLSPARRRTRSPPHGAKQAMWSETKPSPDGASRPLCPNRADGETDRDDTRVQPSRSSPSKAAPQPKARTPAPLARSFVPQDYQHYLGPQKTAHVPPFHREDDVAGESDTSPGSNAGDPQRSSSWIVQNKEANSSQEKVTRAWSLTRASPGSHDESPIMSALKRFSSRMSSSKSLENLTTQPRGEGTERDSSEQLNLSVDDVSSASTLPSSKQMKSVSVPLFQQDETDSDGTSETNLGWRRNTGSSTSNLSLSSGMASMSSQVSGSTSSIFPTDSCEVEVKGNIQFAVNYIQKLEEFHIFVVHCRELAVADSKKNRSDPYVKCYLLPDKTKLGKRKTSVKKKTLNPDYNEILRFKIEMEVLTTQNLNVSVWHNDTFGRNSFLGEVELDLSEWDFSNTQINEYTLKARVSAQSSNHSSPAHLKDSRGRMRVALRFLPQTSHSKRTSATETGEVQIWVKDCKNLPPIRGVIIDPFVKCTVLPDTSRKSRQKTRVVKRTANPLFNHTMVYDGFRAEDLREACVEITVWDHDRLSNHYIGGLRLGLGTGKSYGVEVFWMDSTLAEATLWQRMLEADGEWVEGILPLRMFVMAKSMSK